ncbi:MAG: crossover junction endodeoxyribonuclease RuvC [Eubacteriales bacterium]|nr:crossover junction endodeoxyribonuclease RuvC [Eubacteriales bacterium]
MIILGLDPGLAIVGWGVLESARRGFRVLGYGSVTTPANTPTEERLATIYSDMNELFMRFRPDAVSVEELFFSKNITTGIRVAEARGVLLLSAQQHCVPVFEYSPPQVKQAVVGYGNAEKRQVISMVTSLLSLKAPPKPDDTADALALAICHANSAASPLARLGQ